ncbi:hypothetical protein GCM10007924_06300 [Sneathiella chinensis]|uniref:Uncharacterized protein n=1 Tax=Sneathiella chinensis TaxID=349750 RepID=A0ABQ5U2C0_9PROT|nr:hypothetical protein GCM10007924_06300 [Sneathiella chinensis]
MQLMFNELGRFISVKSHYSSFVFTYSLILLVSILSVFLFLAEADAPDLDGQVAVFSDIR